MTNRLAGIAALKEQLAKVDHAIEHHTAKAAERLEATVAAVGTKFAAFHKRLDDRDTAFDQSLAEVNASLDEIDKLATNGGPPLAGSSQSSTASAPVALCSWGGEQFRARLIAQEVDGTWQAEALDKQPRFAIGDRIHVKPEEIVVWPEGMTKGPADGQA